MREEIEVRVNGNALMVPAGSSVAVAMAISGDACRTSVIGEQRGPLCGMGICFECRATVNGSAHTRTCQMLCEPAMEILTS